MATRAFTKTFKANSVKRHHSYNIEEIVELLGIDMSTAHRWTREGLIAIDDGTPKLIYGQVLQDFLKYKNDSRKFQVGENGSFPCMSCKAMKMPFKRKVIIDKVKTGKWRMKALCEACGSKMNKITSPQNELTIIMLWGFTVAEQLPLWSISYTSPANSNTTMEKRSMKGKNSVQFKPDDKIKYNPVNERLKKKYVKVILGADGLSQKTADTALNAIYRFELFTDFADFKKVNMDITIKFKTHIKNLKAVRSGEGLGKSAIYHVMYSLKVFMVWLSQQDGYKSQAIREAIPYFRLTEKEMAQLKTQKPKTFLEIDKWEDALFKMDTSSEIGLRNRAMIAFLMLTGLRVSALLSIRIGDVDLMNNFVFLDSNHVNNKFSDSFRVDLLCINDKIKQILADWIESLHNKYGFTANDPLFPRSRTVTNDELNFERSGFLKHPMTSVTSAENIVKEALTSAGLPYCSPHTIRNTITAVISQIANGLEEAKSFSQNFGHKQMTTTYNSYFHVEEYRKAEIISEVNIPKRLKTAKLKKDTRYQHILSKLENEEDVERVFRFLVGGE